MSVYIKARIGGEERSALVVSETAGSVQARVYGKQRPPKLGKPRTISKSAITQVKLVRGKPYVKYTGQGLAGDAPKSAPKPSPPSAPKPSTRKPRQPRQPKAPPAAPMGVMHNPALVGRPITKADVRRGRRFLVQFDDAGQPIGVEPVGTISEGKALALRSPEMVGTAALVEVDRSWSRD